MFITHCRVLLARISSVISTFLDLSARDRQVRSELWVYRYEFEACFRLNITSPPCTPPQITIFPVKIRVEKKSADFITRNIGWEEKCNKFISIIRLQKEGSKFSEEKRLSISRLYGGLLKFYATPTIYRLNFSVQAQCLQIITRPSLNLCANFFQNTSQNSKILDTRLTGEQYLGTNGIICRPRIRCILSTIYGARVFFIGPSVIVQTKINTHDHSGRVRTYEIAFRHDTLSNSRLERERERGGRERAKGVKAKRKVTWTCATSTHECAPKGPIFPTWKKKERKKGKKEKEEKGVPRGDPWKERGRGRAH